MSKPTESHTSTQEAIAAIITTRRDDLIRNLNTDSLAAIRNPRYNFFTVLNEIKQQYPFVTAGDLHAAIAKAQRAHLPRPKPAATKAEISNDLLRQAQFVAVRYARRKVRDAADDVAQDAVIQVWKTFDTFDPSRCTFNGWVRMITNSLCKSLWQSQKPEHTYCDHLEDVDIAVPNVGTTLANRLPEMSNLDQAIVEDIMAGYSVTDTAKRLGLTRKAVRYRLDRLGKKQ